MRFVGKYRIIHGIIGLKIVNVVLIHYFKADEERTRLRGAVEITGITELALIQVFLEAVEYILHTGVQLELDVVVQHEGIVFSFRLRSKNWGVVSMRSSAMYPA